MLSSFRKRIVDPIIGIEPMLNLDLAHAGTPESGRWRLRPLTLKFCLCFLLGQGLSGVPAKADMFAATVKDDSTSTSEAKSFESSAPASDEDTNFSRKASEIPHFWQRDPRGGFANDGADYCCPVAVSNSLVYLAEHGFPALLPDGDDGQIDLINTLASSTYFGTDPDTGTGPGAVLAGVRKYIENQGYACERLEYEGWRNVGKSQSAAVLAARPELSWVKEGISNPRGAVWLNIGWYVRGDSANEWRRVGGHWVTLVGYASESQMLIHNPATRGNGENANNPAGDAIHLTAVPDGLLQVGKGATQNAAGMYRISGPGLPIGKHVDAAFLDGAVVLVIGS
jgi:hypothetical protein